MGFRHSSVKLTDGAAARTQTLQLQPECQCRAIGVPTVSQSQQLLGGKQGVGYAKRTACGGSYQGHP